MGNMAWSTFKSAFKSNFLTAGGWDHLKKVQSNADSCCTMICSGKKCDISVKKSSLDDAKKKYCGPGRPPGENGGDPAETKPLKNDDDLSLKNFCSENCEVPSTTASSSSVLSVGASPAAALGLVQEQAPGVRERTIVHAHYGLQGRRNLDKLKRDIEGADVTGRTDDIESPQEVEPIDNGRSPHSLLRAVRFHISRAYVSVG